MDDPECSACIGQGAVACATSDAHIGNPPPAAAMVNAATAATARMIGAWRRGIILCSIYPQAPRAVLR